MNGMLVGVAVRCLNVRDDFSFLVFLTGKVVGKCHVSSFRI